MTTRGMRVRPSPLLAGCLFDFHPGRRDLAVGIRGDVRPHVLIEVVADHQRAVLPDPDEVGRDCKRLLAGASDGEVPVERVLDDVLLAGRSYGLQTVEPAVEVELDVAARGEVLAQEEVQRSRAGERFSGARVR